MLLLRKPELDSAWHTWSGVQGIRTLHCHLQARRKHCSDIYYASSSFCWFVFFFVAFWRMTFYHWTKLDTGHLGGIFALWRIVLFVCVAMSIVLKSLGNKFIERWTTKIVLFHRKNHVYFTTRWSGKEKNFAFTWNKISQQNGFRAFTENRHSYEKDFTTKWTSERNYFTTKQILWTNFTKRFILQWNWLYEEKEFKTDWNETDLHSWTSWRTRLYDETEKQTLWRKLLFEETSLDLLQHKKTDLTQTSEEKSSQRNFPSFFLTTKRTSQRNKVCD